MKKVVEIWYITKEWYVSEAPEDFASKWGVPSFKWKGKEEWKDEKDAVASADMTEQQDFKCSDEWEVHSVDSDAEPFDETSLITPDGVEKVWDNCDGEEGGWV